MIAFLFFAFVSIAQNNLKRPNFILFVLDDQSPMPLEDDLANDPDEKLNVF